MTAKVPPGAPVQIPPIVNLTLSAKAVMLFLELLGEQPYKLSAPIIAEIEPQILAQQVIDERESNPPKRKTQ